MGGDIPCNLPCKNRTCLYNIYGICTDNARCEECGENREVDALKQRLAAKDEVLKRCAAFLGETIQCGVEGEMLDGRHVNVAASDLADDIDDLLKQRTEASHPEGREG